VVLPKQNRTLMVNKLMIDDRLVENNYGNKKFLYRQKKFFLTGGRDARVPRNLPSKNIENF